MPMENHFNLIDEPWIPIAEVGRVSLKQLFSNPGYRSLGGNPVQKIALTKLLLAIAQAAYTPDNDADWAALQSSGMAQKCLTYLEQWHDRFWLYGDKPFLQMPIIMKLVEKRKILHLEQLKLKAASKGKKTASEIENEAKPKSIGAGFYPDLPASNNTILTQAQFDHILTDAEKAIFIVTLMNFAFGGKRVEKDLPSLTVDYKGKTISAKRAPSIGMSGYLHSYLLGSTVLDTLWLGVLTEEQIKQNKYWEGSDPVGSPPWVLMPEGEDCEVAKKFKKSYMACLIAMSRFLLLQEEGIYYVEGIQYNKMGKSWREPSISINTKGSSLTVDLNKRPWRQLTSLLAFLGEGNNQQVFGCQQIRIGLKRMLSDEKPVIWSGGLRLRDNSGDQSVKQDDDFVESTIMLPSSKNLEKSGIWFEQIKNEMLWLEELSKDLDKHIVKYHENGKKNNVSKKKNTHSVGIAANAISQFWQLCERKQKILVDVCQKQGGGEKIRKIFIDIGYEIYDAFCSKETARQLEAWAECRPQFSKYLR